jgi:hypothetical protein
MAILTKRGSFGRSGAYAPMVHLHTDGAQVFSLWNNEGMTSRPKLSRGRLKSGKVRANKLTTEYRQAAQEAARITSL